MKTTNDGPDETAGPRRHRHSYAAVSSGTAPTCGAFMRPHDKLASTVKVYDVHFQFEAERDGSAKVAVKLAEALPGAAWGLSSFKRPKYPTLSLVEAADDPMEAVATASRRVRNAYELLGVDYPRSIALTVVEQVSS